MVEREDGNYWIILNEGRFGETPQVAEWSSLRGWAIWGMYEEISDNEEIIVLSERLVPPEWKSQS